ncbi:MAG: DUF835 domain-containing protein [Thermoplasmata archaeon]|nr:DUF835 domain-containing protein [Thermoplasmata archaeon]
MEEEKLKSVLAAVYKMGYEEALQEASRYARRARTITELLLYLNSKLSILDKECANKSDELLTFSKEFEKAEARKRVEMEEHMVMPGQSILFCEERPGKSVDYMVEIAEEKGVAVLCLTRKPKELLEGREKNLKDGTFKIVWLSKIEKEGGLSKNGDDYTPTGLSICDEISTTQDINRITSIVQEYLTNTSPPLIYLDGLSYLITQTDFTKVLKLVQWICEQVAVKNGYFIVSADPGVFETREFEKLKSEMDLVR